jgi:hypothetical protein
LALGLLPSAVLGQWVARSIPPNSSPATDNSAASNPASNPATDNSVADASSGWRPCPVSKPSEEKTEEKSEEKKGCRTVSYDDVAVFQLKAPTETVVRMPDEGSEEIPVPSPMAGLPPRSVGPYVAGDSSYEDDGLLQPYDDVGTWQNPYAGQPNSANRELLLDRLWLRSEYLFWWTRGPRLPVLATTSPSGTLPQNSGILGRHDTEILLGNQQIMTESRSGGRFTVGYLLSDWAGLAVEANYFFLGTAACNFEAGTANLPIIARPYYDLHSPAESSLLVSHPAYLNGSIQARATTDLQGAEALLRKIIWQGSGERFDLLVGYRFSRLDDGLQIGQSSRWTVAHTPNPANTIEDRLDSFSTENQFHGGDLGLSYRARTGMWTLEILGKVGLGSTNSRVIVDGSMVRTSSNGNSATFSGGMLAQDTNIGTYVQDRFSVIPELGVTVGCSVTPQIRLSAGYTFMYWNNILRAGDQIDSGLSQLPPSAPTGVHRPIVPMRQADFWAQGLRFGFDYVF